MIALMGLLLLQTPSSPQLEVRPIPALRNGFTRGGVEQERPGHFSGDGQSFRTIKLYYLNQAPPDRARPVGAPLAISVQAPRDPAPLPRGGRDEARTRGCQAAFQAGMEHLVEEAKARGADALIGIDSGYGASQHRSFRSFICGAGGVWFWAQPAVLDEMPPPGGSR